MTSRSKNTDEFSFSWREVALGAGLFSVTAIIVVVAIWHSPFRATITQWISEDLPVQHDPTIRGACWGIGGLAVGTFVFVPLMASLTANAVIFGPIWGSVYSLLGMGMAGTLQFFFGRFFHRQVLARVKATSIENFRSRFLQAGPWPIVALRILPVAPFIVVNLCAGALKYRVRDFLIGHWFGSILPVAAVAVFEYNLEILSPTANLRGFFIAIVACATALILAQKLLRPIFEKRTAKSRE